MMVRQRFNKLASNPATSSPAIAWLLVALYCLLIFLQSAFPTPGDLPGIPGIDKLIHLLIYLPLGLLFARAYGLSLPKPNARSLFLLAWFSAILYGASDEVHQSFVAARSADPVDWLADTAGGGIGAALYLRLRGRWRRDA
jgi:VanZ family protein